MMRGRGEKRRTETREETSATNEEKRRLEGISFFLFFICAPNDRREEKLNIHMKSPPRSLSVFFEAFS